MAMRLGELVERYDPGLELMVEGTAYKVPLASAELGLWCRTNAILARQVYEAGGGDQARDEAAEQALVLPDELSFEQWMLGDAYDKMVANQVASRLIDFCARTAFLWHSGADETQVAEFWNAGGDPEARRPNRADKRAAKKATGGRRTAAATAIPKPASSSGTKSPTASARPRKATGARRGPRSSGTGG